MKRRFESNELNKPNSDTPSSYPPHERDNLQQQQQQSSSPEGEYGLGIESRVLKKMRGIKLDSEYVFWGRSKPVYS